MKFAYAIILSAAAATASCASAAAPPCASQARQQASKLLAFHVGETHNPIEIDPTVKALPSLRNPADQKQRFEVLQVWGHVYKGRYRMRLIYYHTPEVGCVLMGQEILEYAHL